MLTNQKRGYTIEQMFLKGDYMKELSVLDTKISYFNIDIETQ